MKRTVNTSFFILFIAGLLSMAPSKSTVENAVAILTFEKEVVDYGTIEQHADGTKIFSFKNEGDAPLIISNVKTTCGCTVPNYSKDPILPGDSGELEIKYDTKKLGAFTKTITVYSNAKEGKKTLKIKGTVVAAK